MKPWRNSSVSFGSRLIYCLIFITFVPLQWQSGGSNTLCGLPSSFPTFGCSWFLAKPTSPEQLSVLPFSVFSLTKNILFFMLTRLTVISNTLKTKSSLSVWKISLNLHFKPLTPYFWDTTLPGWPSSLPSVHSCFWSRESTILLLHWNSRKTPSTTLLERKKERQKCRMQGTITQISENSPAWELT